MYLVLGLVPKFNLLHPTFCEVEARPCSSVVLSVDPSSSSRNQISINESGVTLYYTSLELATKCSQYFEKAIVDKRPNILGYNILGGLTEFKCLFSKVSNRFVRKC